MIFIVIYRIISCYSILLCLYIYVYVTYMDHLGSVLSCRPPSKAERAGGAREVRILNPKG